MNKLERLITRAPLGLRLLVGGFVVAVLGLLIGTADALVDLWYTSLY